MSASVTPAADDGFNPLPPPKRGETLRSVKLATHLQSFNPLPPPKRGETAARAYARNADKVSIHSPRRSEGRLSSPDQGSTRSMFQSTPPAEARGDAREA